MNFGDGTDLALDVFFSCDLAFVLLTALDIYTEALGFSYLEIVSIKVDKCINVSTISSLDTPPLPLFRSFSTYCFSLDYPSIFTIGGLVWFSTFETLSFPIPK